MGGREERDLAPQLLGCSKEKNVLPRFSHYRSMVDRVSRND